MSDQDTPPTDDSTQDNSGVKVDKAENVNVTQPQEAPDAPETPEEPETAPEPTETPDAPEEPDQG